MTTLMKNQVAGMNYASLSDDVLNSMDRSELIRLVKEQNADLEEMEAEKSSLEAQVEAQNKEIISIKMDKISLEFKLNDSQKEIERIRLQQESYRVTIQSLREEKTRANQRAKELEEQIKAIVREEREEESAKKQLADLRKSHEELKTKFKGYRKDAKAKIEALETELSRYGTVQDSYAKQKTTFENSSLPSSKCVGRSKVVNSRERSGLKPGAQKGHKGHGRKDIPATRLVEHVPNCVLENPDDWEEIPDSEKIYKEINIKVLIDVLGHVIKSYRNKKTGEVIRAQLPEGIYNEINYGPSIQALIGILNIYYGLSVKSVKELLKYLSNKTVSLSDGYIHSVQGKMAKKLRKMNTKALLEDILLDSEFLGDDATYIMVNGTHKYIYNTCSTQASVYYYRTKKGCAAHEGRAISRYEGPCTHDHDISYYRLKLLDQECVQHIMRYLKKLEEGKDVMLWPIKMHKYLSYLIHIFDHTGQSGEKRIGNEKEISPEDARKQYKGILALAHEELEADPKAESVYHKDAQRLSNRLEDYEDSVLRFIDLFVPATNNMTEKELRVTKRKTGRMGTFRAHCSDEELKTKQENLSVVDYCEVMSLLRTGIKQGDDPMEILDFIAGLNV